MNDLTPKELDHCYRRCRSEALTDVLPGDIASDQPVTGTRSMLKCDPIIEIVQNSLCSQSLGQMLVAVVEYRRDDETVRLIKLRSGSPQRLSNRRSLQLRKTTSHCIVATLNALGGFQPLIDSCCSYSHLERKSQGRASRR